MKIFIISAGDLISGGIQSLHNLAAVLNMVGYEVRIFYLRPKKEILDHPIIKQYQLKNTNVIEDEKKNLLIVSETETKLFDQYKNINKAVYWLSVRFFFKCEPFRTPLTCKPLRKSISTRNYYGYGNWIEKQKRKSSYFMKSIDPCWGKNVYHITNSQHALMFCKTMGVNHPYLLHNPLRSDLIKSAIKTKQLGKEDLILFGPKKPKYILLLTKIFLNKKYRIVRAKRIKPELLVELMKKAKLFCEFGNSPGRDRMPREAALFNCIVLTNNRGGSGNNIDLPIPNNYKINDHLLNVFKILSTIKTVIKNYNKYNEDFNTYREVIINEASDFEKNTKDVFETISKLV